MKPTANHATRFGVGHVFTYVLCMAMLTAVGSVAGGNEVGEPSTPVVIRGHINYRIVLPNNQTALSEKAFEALVDGCNWQITSKETGGLSFRMTYNGTSLLYYPLASSTNPVGSMVENIAVPPDWAAAGRPRKIFSVNWLSILN